MTAQREWFETDYYEVLGVNADASQKDITKAYRKLARELHPDKNPGDAAAEERFKGVSAAYDVLGDEDKRREYDEVRRLGPMAGGVGGQPGGAGGFSFNVGDMNGDIGDLLGQMFGRGGGGRRGRPGGGVGPQRGADLTAELTLDFEDAATGLTTTLYLTSDAQCSTCNGSGSKPGTSPQVCGLCGGAGCRRRQPGSVLVLLALPKLPGERFGDHRPVHDVRRVRRGAPAARGQGPDPRRVCPTARRSVCLDVVRPDATGARRATCSSSCTSRRTSGSDVRATI